MYKGQSKHLKSKRIIKKIVRRKAKRVVPGGFVGPRNKHVVPGGSMGPHTPWWPESSTPPANRVIQG